MISTNNSELLVDNDDSVRILGATQKRVEQEKEANFEKYFNLDLASNNYI